MVERSRLLAGGHQDVARVEDSLSDMTRRWGERLVLMSVVLVPFATWSVGGVGPTALVMLAAGWFAFSHRVATGTLRQVPRAVVALGVLALSFVASTAAAQAPANAVRISLTIIIGVGFTLAVTTFVTGPALSRYVSACLVMAGVIGVWSLSSAGQMTAKIGGGVVEGRLQGPFGQPNELGAFCALVLPLCLAAAVSAERRSTRLGAGAVTILVATAGALSLSRGAWMGAVAGVLALLVFLPAVRRPLRRAAAVMAGGLALTAVFTAGSTVSVLTARLGSIGSAADNPQDFRPEVWATGLRVALDHPLLGVGPGQFSIASSNGTYPLYTFVADHPHNLVLTVAAEHGLYGLIAFALVVGLLVAGFVAVVRAPQQHDDPSPARWCAIGSAAGLLALGVHGIVDIPLRNPIVNASVWVVLALAITAAAAVATASAPRSSRGAPHDLL